MNFYIISVSFAIPIFLLLIIIEEYFASRNNLKINRTEDIISSLSSGITNTIRDSFKFGFILISYTWLVNHLTIYKIESLWISIVIAFIIQDFAGYWIHRLNHRINFLWNRHIIHHSSEEFNLSCALRQSISNNFKFGAIFLFPAAILGIQPFLFAIISPLHLFLQFWYHTRLIDKMGFFEKILVTPSHHRVHHAINDEYIDKNYSQIFIFWDKLFGTFQAEKKSNPPIYGILHPVKTWNPIIINFKHLYQMINDALNTKNIYDKLRIWFMPTGWRPSDVIDTFPLITLKNPSSMIKYAPVNSKFKLKWSWFQLLISGLFMYFIFFLINNYSISIILISTIILYLHIMSYTYLLDSNKLAFILELMKCIFAQLFIFILYKNNIIIPKYVFLISTIYLSISIIITVYYTFNKLNKIP